MSSGFGKILIVSGILLIILGLLMVWKIQLPWFGKLPGDIVIKKGNFSLYFPLMTCLLASVVLTLLFYLFRK